MPMIHVQETPRKSAQKNGWAAVDVGSVEWLSVVDTRRSVPAGGRMSRTDEPGLLAGAACTLRLVMNLGGNVERRNALADALVALADPTGLLEDVHVGDHVDLAPGRHHRFDILARLDAIHGGSETRAEEL